MEVSNDSKTFGYPVERQDKLIARGNVGVAELLAPLELAEPDLYAQLNIASESAKFAILSLFQNGGAISINGLIYPSIILDQSLQDGVNLLGILSLDAKMLKDQGVKVEKYVKTFFIAPNMINRFGYCRTAGRGLSFVYLSPLTDEFTSRVMSETIGVENAIIAMTKKIMGDLNLLAPFKVSPTTLAKQVLCDIADTNGRGNLKDKKFIL